MNLIKAYKNKGKMGTYYITAKAEIKEITALCEQDLEKITYLQNKSEQHYLIPNFDDCVKVGITLRDSKEVEFWAEVKSDIPYFSDQGKTITISDFIEDLGKNTFTDLTEFLTKNQEKNSKDSIQMSRLQQSSNPDCNNQVRLS